MQVTHSCRTCQQPASSCIMHLPTGEPPDARRNARSEAPHPWRDAFHQLAQKLTAAGLPESDSGTVYRTLRQLEKSGMVSSFWDTSESGPARRMYTLTKAGELFLSG